MPSARENNPTSRLIKFESHAVLASSGFSFSPRLWRPYRNTVAAVPPDMRKGYALLMSADGMGLCPPIGAKPQSDKWANIRWGTAATAQQAAQPRTALNYILLRWSGEFLELKGL